MRLKGIKAIINGGSKGIGKEIALSYAKEGAEVVLTYFSSEVEANETANIINQLGGKALAIKLNIQRVDDFENFITQSLNFLDEVNVLVNNAGIVKRTPFFEITQDEYNEMMSTNLDGHFFLTQLVAKNMAESRKGGSIINISSISDDVPTDGLTHYQLSKAALTMLTKGAALELAKYNIRVNTIAPGLTKTDMNKEQWENNSETWQSRVFQIPLGKAGTPADLVGIAVFLASNESSWMTGTRIVVDGGRSLI